MSGGGFDAKPTGWEAAVFAGAETRAEGDIAAYAKWRRDSNRTTADFGGYLLPCCGHEDLDHWITETDQGCEKCGCQDRGLAVSAGAETEPQCPLCGHSPVTVTSQKYGFPKVAAQGEPPQALDVETLGQVLYEMGVDDLDLPDARKLAAHIATRYVRLSKPCPRPRHDEHCADLHWEAG